MIANRSFVTSLRAPSLSRLVVLTLTVLACAMPSAASAQRSYQSPEAAAEALADAARSGERKAILSVLGLDAHQIVSSGDPVADAAARQQFLTAYDAKHQIAKEGTEKATLVVGQEDFPFPIPLVRKGDAWQFDAAAGREEILARRIGRNELNAIQTCLAYVDAQQEYAEKGIDGPGVHAQRIVSRPGKKDGLYWPAQPGEAESPLGELAARAAAEGYRAGERRTPYHGYFYRILTWQGPNAPGGALEYRVGGKMIGGFALVAYPAAYGNSGVMTFVVNHQGTVYQKDLGPRSASIAAAMPGFNPDRTWQRVADGVRDPAVTR
jgi:Protein of unknown function (DUF2950)